MIDVEDLKEGSVVRLASGSPRLTVTAISRVTTADGRPTGYAYCRVLWFSNRGELQEAEISSRYLMWPRERPAETPASGLRAEFAAALDAPVSGGAA